VNLNYTMDKKEQEKQEEIEFKHTPKNEHEELRFSFFAEEREHYEKNALWFVLATIFVLVSVTYFIMDESFSSAIVFVLILALFYLFGNNLPRIMEIHLTDKSLYINKKRFEFKDIQTFWIIKDKAKNIHNLNLEIGKNIVRTITIQLHDIPDYLIRAAFKDQIKEDADKEEPVRSKIKRVFKL